MINRPDRPAQAGKYFVVPLLLDQVEIPPLQQRRNHR